MKSSSNVKESERKNWNEIDILGEAWDTTILKADCIDE